MKTSSKSGTLSVAKFNRILRPLLSKIHNLNRLHSKYPDNLLAFKCKEHKQKLKRRPKDQEVLSDSDYSDDEYYLAPPDTSGEEEMYVNPRDSLERLELLKKHLSVDLYQNYIEIFSIFRSVVTTILACHTDGRFLKLSSLCCYKIGKSAVLSTKSTYYKLNQLKLFDQDSIPLELKRFSEVLLDDINDWFSIEPISGNSNYRIQLFVGYLIHLLVVHSNSTLYMLIPVLIHWCCEEYQRTKNTLFHSLYTTLFNEFWNFDRSYCSPDLVGLLTMDRSLFFLHKNAFWYCVRTDYWKHLIETLGLAGSENCSSKLLYTIPLNSKLSFDHIDIVYKLISDNPQHPKSNIVLIHIITQIISENRAQISTCTTSIELVGKLRSSLECLKAFCRVWISFKPDSMVFNTLYGGNESIFKAIQTFSAYLKRKASTFIQHLDILLQDKCDDVNYIDLRKQFRDFRVCLDDFHSLTDIFEVYFLDLEEPLALDYKVGRVSKLVIELQSFERFKINSEFDDWLLWLHHRDHVRLAQACFVKYYGTQSKGQQEIMQTLFEYD